MLRVTDASKTIIGTTIHRASKGLAAQIGTAHGLYVTEAHGATLLSSVKFFNKKTADKISDIYVSVR